jgi:Holliday junction resolvase RusA-like endonuclease
MTLLAVNPTRHKRDLDNLLKAASDILQHAGVIENDSMCRWLEARWMDEGPQCTIIVEPLDDQNTPEITDSGP